MEIGTNDITTNTHIRDDIKKLVIFIDRVGDRTRDLRDGDIIKIVQNPHTQKLSK